MKKLIAIVFAATIVIIALIVLAFYYVDLSGHKGFRYDLFIDGRVFGSLKVDKYVTEDKLIYKTSASYPYSLGYPVINEKLFLKKRTVTPLKYVEEAKGVNGERRLIFLTQDGETTDYLFLKQPEFFTMKEFETGEKTMVFSPHHIMLYMPIMEKYNFWKKGTQSFEVMIPLNEPIPPMRDKVEVRYLNDEYIPIMGSRMEAEIFTVNARALPEMRLHLAKYTRRILSLEIKKMNMRFELVGFIESPGKRFRSLLDTVVRFFRRTEKGIDEYPQEQQPVLSEKAGAAVDQTAGERDKARKTQSEEIFFESDNLILSGRLWIPDGDGPFPAVLIVPRDGPMTNGERYLVESCGEFLSSSGFGAFVFDNPGQGKSQGSIWDMDDEKRIRNILAALSYLQTRPDVIRGSITVMGHKGGGYLALEAAGRFPEVCSCIVLGLPPDPGISGIAQKTPVERIQALLKAHGLGPFDEGYISTVATELEEHRKEAARSTEDFSFVLGVRVPLKDYRGFLDRRPYEALISFDRPLLLIYGRNDRDFSQHDLEGLRRSLRSGEDDRAKIAVFRSLTPYMGEMVGEGNSWRFEANEDVLELVREWIREKGIRKAEPPTVESDETVITY